MTTIEKFASDVAVKVYDVIQKLAKEKLKGPKAMVSKPKDTSKAFPKAKSGIKSLNELVGTSNAPKKPAKPKKPNAAKKPKAVTAPTKPDLMATQAKRSPAQQKSYEAENLVYKAIRGARR